LSKTCTKCKADISDSEQLAPQAEKYPVCNKCWEEWKEMRIMVMNEMHLDMSLADHRKVLKKHEKIFAGIMTPEGDYVDYTNEDNRNPEEDPSKNQ
jgi:Fe-S cluster biosynthesis and repair protein YggX|tara:strand:- start:1824 stop:2111 length:288 start_codon:yes stop_codon:yes gene_type:complete